MRLLSFLVPQRAHHQLVHDLISIRNDIAHGRTIPDHVQDQRLDALLRRFAHRAQSSWRADIAVPMHDIRRLQLPGRGTQAQRYGHAKPERDEEPVPLITGELVLLSADSNQCHSPHGSSHRKQITQVSSIACYSMVYSAPKATAADTPMKYSKVYDGNDLGPMPIQSSGTWQTLASWITQ